MKSQTRNRTILIAVRLSEIKRMLNAFDLIRHWRDLFEDEEELYEYLTLHLETFKLEP